ncbi:MAG: hypothetical protein C0198_00110 [Sulfurihydrogenibium sp.]|nr:MAG: hypothetical protein C0198_00110 [Sulfurihydrogenibium sp.]
MNVRENILEGNIVDTKQLKGKQKNKNVNIFDIILSQTVKQDKTTKIVDKKSLKDLKNEKENPNALSLEENVNNLTFGLESLKNHNNQSKNINLNKNIPDKISKNQDFTNNVNFHKQKLETIKNIEKEIDSKLTNLENNIKNQIDKSKLEDVKNTQKELSDNFKASKLDKNLKLQDILSSLQNQENRLKTENTKNQQKESEEVRLKYSLKDSKLKDLLKSQLNVENKTDKINAFTVKEQKNEHKLDDFLKKLENKEEKAENLKVNDDRNLLINISKNVEQKTDTNTDKPNKNEPFASAYQNAQSVNYDITSGYNSSKSFSDQQQNGQQTPQPNSHVSNYTTNFQINYQDTNINATISKNIVNMFIRSSDIVFTPEMIDGIKNILENSGYKDLRLTLRDKEKVYKFNFSDMNRTETKKGINLVV